LELHQPPFTFIVLFWDKLVTMACCSRTRCDQTNKQARSVFWNKTPESKQHGWTSCKKQDFFHIEINMYTANSKQLVSFSAFPPSNQSPMF